MSDRAFGFLWSLIFAAYSLLPFCRGGLLIIPSAIFAGFLALIAVFAPPLLALPNRKLTRFGKMMNFLISNVVLLLIYFLFLTPGAALLRICGRDQLKRNIDPEVPTYWAERPNSGTDFTRPY